MEIPLWTYNLHLVENLTFVRTIKARPDSSRMKLTVGDIAKMLDADIEGDSDIYIEGPAKIEEGLPGTLTFLSNPKYEPFVYKTTASAVLVSKDFTPTKPVRPALIRVDNVQVSVGQLLNWYDLHNGNGREEVMESSEHAIHPTARIGENVRIGPYCIIEAHAVIADGCILEGQVFIGSHVKIGKNCRLNTGVRVKHGSIVGDDCVFYDNAVIASDGFGYSNSDFGYKKIPQIGIVRIGNKVEIGAGSTIDRAVMGETRIEDGVIIDNLVHIGHNVVVGESTAIAAQSGIAGSTKIGKHCVIGGQVGIVGHISIADRTMIQAKSGLSKRIDQPDMKLFGYPAIQYQDYLKSYAHFKKLPEYQATIRELERRIQQLESGSENEGDQPA